MVYSGNVVINLILFSLFFKKLKNKIVNQLYSLMFIVE